MSCWQRSRNQVSIIGVLLASGGMLLSTEGAMAQIIPDATLGGESSRVIPGDIVDRIDGGATRGSALFHSFESFNVGPGQQVYFASPAGIENILSRVTGLDPSQIDGMLGVDGTANLFLLNPNGILFGPDAQLDVEGSFLASTRDRFQFADGTEFRAADPNAAPLVTVNIPLGLQLGTPVQSPISNLANLSVGADLTLVGSDVTSLGSLAATNGEVRVEANTIEVRSLTARSATLSASETLHLETSRLLTTGDLSLLAGQTVRIRDSETTPFLAAAGGDLTIQGNAGIDILALNHPQTPFQSLGDLTLVSDGTISGDAHFRSGGNFSIEDLDGNPGNFVSLYDPIISANGNVTFGNYAGTALKVEATGNISVTGDITITGPDTELDPAFAAVDPDFDTLTTQAALILRAGVDLADINNTEFDIPVPESTPTFVGETAFTPSAGTIADPTTEQILPTGSILLIGDVSTTGTDLGYVQDGYTAGPILLSAIGDIVIEGSLDTSADFETVNSSAGAVDVDANGTVTFREGALFSTSQAGGTGGDFSVTGATINFQEYFVSLDANEGGRSGDIRLNATQAIALSEFSFLSTDAFNDGDAGNISVNAGQSVSLVDNSDIASTADDGRSGTISITTGALNVVTSFIDSGVFGSGQSGNVNINVDTLTLDAGEISNGPLTNEEEPVETVQGTGGSINIDAGSILLRNESTIIAFEGDITITADAIVAASPTGPFGSDIYTDSVTGTPGTITLSVGTLDGIAVRSALTAQNDIVGEVVTVVVEDEPPTLPGDDDIETISGTLENDDDEEEIALPSAELLDQEIESRELTAQCFQGLLVQGGRGGLPDNPTDLLRAIAPALDWVNLTANDSEASANRRLPDSTTTLSEDRHGVHICDRA